MVNKIITAAESLFMRNGIKAISMDDVSNHVGISKKTLYQYFKDKEELVFKVMEHHMSSENCCMLELTANTNNPIEEMLGISNYVLELLGKINPGTIHDMRKYYRELWEKFTSERNQMISSQIQDNIRRGINEGLYRDDADPEIISLLYITKVTAIINQDLFPPSHFDRKVIFKQHMVYHLNGIASPKGLKLIHQYFYSVA